MSLEKEFFSEYFSCNTSRTLCGTVNSSTPSTPKNYMYYNTTFPIFVCVLYGILFCIGLAGNAWVISVISYILKTFRGNLNQKNQNVFLYVLSLSLVDTLVLLNLPMLICDIAFARWMFGGTMCKIYYTIESVNKIFSKFILTAISFDRYLAVCRPDYLSFVRSSKGTILILTVSLSTVVISLYPVYIYAEEIHFDEIYDVDNETIVGQTTKCVLHMDDKTLISFTIYLFIGGFCIPSVLTSYFYFRIACRVYDHRRSVNERSHIPFKRVTGTIFLLILIYFTCWTPFWITTIYLTVEKHDEPNTTEISLMYVVHLFVYVNSAINWILYAYLNKNLKEARNLAIKRNVDSRTRLLEINKRQRWTDFNTFRKRSTTF